MVIVAHMSTVHDTCLDLARQSTSRVERYLLLRLALRAEKADLTALMDSPAMVTLIGSIAPSLGAMLGRLATPRPVSTATAN